MFRAILLTQWKGTRLLVLLATLVGFALPLASLQSARNAYNAIQFIAEMQRWAGGYALLAAGVGLLVAMAAWQPDHAGRHVYALALPVTRSRYAMMRMGAGALFLLPPVIGVLAGSLVVAASDAIPIGLHAYPVALALRFLFAAIVAYGIFFAIAASTSQSAGVILGLIAAVLFTQYVLSVTGSNENILKPIVDFVFMRPGVLSIFAGRWMLIDA
jgi:hypothetical protein